MAGTPSRRCPPQIVAAAAQNAARRVLTRNRANGAGRLGDDKLREPRRSAQWARIPVASLRLSTPQNAHQTIAREEASPRLPSHLSPKGDRRTAHPKAIGRAVLFCSLLFCSVPSDPASRGVKPEGARPDNDLRRLGLSLGPRMRRDGPYLHLVLSAITPLSSGPGSGR